MLGCTNWLLLCPPPHQVPCVCVIIRAFTYLYTFATTYHSALTESTMQSVQRQFFSAFQFGSELCYIPKDDRKPPPPFIKLDLFINLVVSLFTSYLFVSVAFWTVPSFCWQLFWLLAAQTLTVNGTSPFFYSFLLCWELLNASQPFLPGGVRENTVRVGG